jgi:hypothetical protein
MRRLRVQRPGVSDPARRQLPLLSELPSSLDRDTGPIGPFGSANPGFKIIGHIRIVPQ